jgi:hypothetical protein
MEQKLVQALVAHYNGEIQRAEANLINYFKNPAGIGEHPDIVGEMIKLVDSVSAARGGLDVVNSLVQAPAETASEEVETESPGT